MGPDQGSDGRSQNRTGGLICSTQCHARFCSPKGVRLAAVTSPAGSATSGTALPNAGTPSSGSCATVPFVVAHSVPGQNDRLRAQRLARMQADGRCPTANARCAAPYSDRRRRTSDSARSVARRSGSIARAAPSCLTGKEVAASTTAMFVSTFMATQELEGAPGTFSSTSLSWSASSEDTYLRPSTSTTRTDVETTTVPRTLSSGASRTRPACVRRITTVTDARARPGPRPLRRHRRLPLPQIRLRELFNPMLERTFASGRSCPSAHSCPAHSVAINLSPGRATSGAVRGHAHGVLNAIITEGGEERTGKADASSTRAATCGCSSPLTHARCQTSMSLSTFWSWRNCLGVTSRLMSAFTIGTAGAMTTGRRT